MKGSVLVLEPDCTAVMHAIHRARERMAPLKGIHLACAAVQEMQFIIAAFDAYQAQAAAAHAAREPDAEEAHSPKPRVLQ